MWRLRSLRGRLVAGLLAVVAIGLFGASVGIYAALGTFLQSRTDEQLRNSRQAVLTELQRGASFAGDLTIPSGTSVIPDGTYGELRDSANQPVQFYKVVNQAPPDVADRTYDKISYSTAPAVGGLTDYRVMATPARDGSLLIVALPLDENRQILRRLVGVELAMGLAVLAGLAVMAWSVVGLGLLPLAEIGRTADAIAEGDMSRRVEHTDERSEIGRLGQALNKMLGRIESAFAERRESEDRLRRFVADASHELRTPLTSIRGYAELFRRGAADRPEDLATAMRRIEEESARMGVLVEDLLLLARLDQGRPLDRSPVDLSRLAADAVTDARAVSPESEIVLSNGAPVMVLGDELRLRQVAANLLSNAEVHTPPGTVVKVTVDSAGDTARLVVSDDGPGLPPGLSNDVFQRFFRVDKARSRATGGGAGLGLSIAAAVAEAHGGSVRLENGRELGGIGATFVVELPLYLPPPPPPPSPVAPPVRCERVRDDDS
ncbi:MAG: HAMP domain-containing histidine kinase [Actinobacteria bacterium]|nr:HAMP domain-containing histidine kinase [Actinomycetota bacterium]